MAGPQNGVKPEFASRFRVMTGHEMAVRPALLRGIQALAFLILERVRTSRVKVTSPWGIGGTRHVTMKQESLTFATPDRVRSGCG